MKAAEQPKSTSYHPLSVTKLKVVALAHRKIEEKRVAAKTKISSVPPRGRESSPPAQDPKKVRNFQIRKRNEVQMRSDKKETVEKNRASTSVMRITTKTRPIVRNHANNQHETVANISNRPTQAGPVIPSAIIRSQNALPKDKEGARSTQVLVNKKSKRKTENVDKIMPPTHITYYFSMKPGNNSELIERIIMNRSWWKRIPKGFSKNAAAFPNMQINFFWRMLCKRFKFSQLVDNSGSYLAKKSCNRFSHADELGDKDNYFRNMWFYSQRKGLDVFDIVPLTFSFRMQEYQYDKDIQEFCRFFLAEQKKCPLEEIKPVRTYLDEKTQTNIDIYFEFDFTSKQRCFKERKFTNFESLQIKKHPTFFSGRNYWIIKPSGCDRGKGVEIFKSLDELSKFLYMYSSGYNMSEYMNMNYNDNDEISPALKEGAMELKSKKTIFNKFVIQKYMEKPALFKGFKFDIRAHALLTQDGSVYVFRDSYVRISSLKYSLDKSNYFAHLCNTSVNMKSNSFGQIAVGNTISVVELAQFFDDLESKNPSRKTDKFEPYFFEEINKLIKYAFNGCLERKDLINPMGIPNSFELFGFDIMVDENYRCWLIEANFIPGLTDEDNDYLKKYLDRMMDDMFKLTLDQIYPMPRNATRAVEQYPFLDFPSDENLWKFLCKFEHLG